MKDISEEEIKAGQAIYTPLLLKIYDLYVINFSNRWVWRCPKKRLLQQFQENISNNHLDIGVGTGYYLQRCEWPQNTKLALMDLNQTCLDTAQNAVTSVTAMVYQADIFKSQPHLENRFDSISMNFLLHCLPGDMENKSAAIHNAVQMLKPNGVLFGATILSDKDLNTPLSSHLASLYNKKGIFSNQNDTHETLSKALQEHLDDVEIKIVGSVALFKGYKR